MNRWGLLELIATRFHSTIDYVSDPDVGVSPWPSTRSNKGALMNSVLVVQVQGVIQSTTANGKFAEFGMINEAHLVHATLQD